MGLFIFAFGYQASIGAAKILQERLEHQQCHLIGYLQPEYLDLGIISYCEGKFVKGGVDSLCGVHCVKLVRYDGFIYTSFIHHRDLCAGHCLLRSQATKYLQ